MSERTTTVDLLRHGACAGGDIFRGVTDSALTDQGWHQMTAALARHGGWQRVVSSPLQRCADFAERFAHDRGLPLAHEVNLREIHFGRWEGRDIAEVWREEGAFVARYYREPGNLAPPGGESAAEASARLVQVWNALLARHRGEHLLLVCHGGVIRLLLCHLLAAPLASSTFFHVPYGCLVRLQVYHLNEGDAPQLIFHQPGEADV
ncbi:MAG: histidine phosphatase family protein [Porticoccaceae bacterium]